MSTRYKYQFCAFLLAQLKFSKGFIHGVDLTAFFESKNGTFETTSKNRDEKKVRPRKHNLFVFRKRVRQPTFEPFSPL